MKKANLILPLLLFFVALNSSCSSSLIPTSIELEKGFVNIPDSIQTSIYWYWISDHISKEGVIKDLQAMKEAGINRAFIGNIGLDDSEAGVGNVKFYSDEWWEILHAALKTATDLGIDIGIFNSPGWSQSGGPWVQPEEAMRYLAYTKKNIIGGDRIQVKLERPDSPYQDSFQDVKVLAFPTLPGANSLSLQNTKVTSNPSIAHIESIITGSKEVILNPNHEPGKNVSIDFSTTDSFTLRSLKIYTTEVGIDSQAKLEVEEGGEYKEITQFSIARFNPALNVGFDPYAPIVISTPSTRGNKFRLTLYNVAGGAGLKKVLFSSNPCVERYPEKTLAKMHQTPLPFWHEYQWDNQPIVDESNLLVDATSVLDITEFLDGEVLTWDAPEGNWTILRTGMLPTGVTNGPARPEARGLEIDKMSKTHVKTHFEAFLGKIYERIPAKDRACWKVVVQDSYETGGQNFTDTFLEDFEARYGYNPVPFLPIYSGIVVESQEISDRFLWDMRRLVADKIAYDYVGGLRDVSHQYGLTTWLENYGHWGFPGEFLQYGGQSDEIGGEFWSEGSLGDIENRAASSCGHIYGKNKISAESFTAGGGAYHRYPALMKQRGDRFFSEGINNTLLHLYICQPYEDKEPGVNAPFANEFNRKNTWYPHLDLFTTYLKRVNYMLQQGLNVADVAYFIGEDTPKMTGITDPALPKGYQFDYINAEVIERDLFVKDGLLTLPHGTQYKVLVLPPMDTMRPELLEKIKELIHQGAVVLGNPPKRSPSLENFPNADEIIQSLADELWGKIDRDKKYASIGLGKLMQGISLEEVFELINVVPDCKLNEEDPILYGHRKVNNQFDIYFITNQSNELYRFTPEFRVKGLSPELWNPVNGAIRELKSFQFTDGGTAVPIQLDSYESAFIVFRKQANETKEALDIRMNYPTPHVLAELNKGWTVSFDSEKRGPKAIVMDELVDITTHINDSIKYYSGTIQYENSFKLDHKKALGRVFLKAHDLSAMAKVEVNGELVGGFWTAPYQVDITDYITNGRNQIKIEVTTTWVNRIIGDLKLPIEERKTWLTFQPWNENDGLHKSGLIGPVVIESYDY